MRRVSMGLVGVGVGVALGAAVLLWLSRPAPLRGQRTSVLLIVIDTLRADHLGCYGYEVDTSPNIDALAQRGVLFENFFTTAPWTRPGVASLTTGLYARTAGIYDEDDALSTDLHTLAERLDRRGYETIGVNANPNVAARYGFAQGFDHWTEASDGWEFSEGAGAPRRTQRGPDKAVKTGASRVTELALEALEHRDSSKPFYLQLLYIDPHLPREPAAEDRQRMEAAGSRQPEYDGEVVRVDREVGRLLSTMDASGLLDDTLVVLTADHGEGLDSHPGVGHSTTHGPLLYDSVLHIPLLFSHPSLPDGRVRDEMASAVDLAPTVLDLLGFDWPARSFQGHSAAALVRGEPSSGDRSDHAFSETHLNASKVAVRTRTDKLIRNDDCREARETDTRHPGCVYGKAPPKAVLDYELLDRTEGGAEHPSQAARGAVGSPVGGLLAQRLRDWEDETRRREPMETSSSVTQREREVLRALGYLQGEPVEQP